MPVRSHAVRRFLAARSPPAGSPGDSPVRPSREGSGPETTPSGTRTLRGVASGSRTERSLHRRKNGVNTAKWSEAAGVTAPGASTVVTASWTCSRQPRAPSADRRCSSRRCAYALTSAAMCTSSASASPATAHTCATRSPDRTTSRPPRSRRPASRSRRQSASRASRLGAANPAASTARSRTNSGTTAAERPRAARSGGWSCSRRSRVNRTTDVTMALLAGGSGRRYRSGGGRPRGRAGTLPRRGRGGPASGRVRCARRAGPGPGRVGHGVLCGPGAEARGGARRWSSARLSAGVVGGLGSASGGATRGDRGRGACGRCEAGPASHRCGTGASGESGTTTRLPGAPTPAVAGGHGPQVRWAGLTGRAGCGSRRRRARPARRCG